MADALPGMEHLTEALRTTAAGAGTFVTVRGPMGAGKSALLRALAELADSVGAVVRRASGAPAEQDWDYGVAEQIGPVPAGFVVIVVDDLQWADEKSVRWLIDIAASALVVTAVRDGEPGADIALPGPEVRLQAVPSAAWSRRRVADCLSRQPEPVRRVARAMAVLGEHDLGLITELAGLDDVTTATAVRTLRALGLVADAVLATMTASEHDAWHLAAAVLLHDRGRPVEQVADHLVETRSALPEWAIEVLRAAARPSYLRRAVAEQGPERAALLVELAVAECATDNVLALQHLSYAIGLHSSPRDRAAAVLAMPVAVLGVAPPLARDVISDVERGVRELGDGDLSARIEARMRYAGHTDPTELTDSISRLRELGPEPDTSSAAKRELLTVLSFSAALAARVPATEVAVLAGRLLEHPPPDQMRQLLVTTLRAADSPLGEIAGGPFPDAMLSLAGVDNPGTALVLDLARAADEVAAGDVRGGLRGLTHAGRQLDQLGWRNVVLFPWRTTAARLHQQLGDITAAMNLAEEEHERAVEWGAPAGVGRTLRVLGGLTEGTAGVDLLHAAVDALSSSADRLELARAHLALGLRLREKHERAGTEHLRRCLDIAGECGDERLARQARSHLRGEVRRAELTRTERRVVALAVAGQSNQEIAHTLSVSTRAVEKHLTNSYRKLGIRFRAELAGALNHWF
ncbi:LuxR C-terminal-related transcriptional regulator [Lentzea sp. NPDC006480]|uniref:LuxR C-terminal-related transcriptional regulator n=1 Tax=Lentzea sp. NPDC006480 TaxID=3157176 RepID=UPI0033B5A2F5